MKIKTMKTQHTTLIIAAATFLSSCVTVLPSSTPNVPFLREKGDGKLTTNLVVTEGGGIGGSVQAAYSPADKFYLGLNGSMISYGEGLHSNMFELGAGTYIPVGRHFSFDLSGGGGLGSNNTLESSSMSRFYIQPAFAYTRPKLQVGIGAKLNHTAFNVRSSSEESLMSSEDFNAKTLDPFFLVRFGQSKFQFQILYSGSILLDNKLDYIVPEKSLSLGLHFFIGNKKLLH